MENATLTGLVSIHSGTLLRSVCANREANPRRSFVIAFQSVACDWPAIVGVRLMSRLSSVRCTMSIFQTQRRSSLLLTLTHGGTLQICRSRLASRVVGCWLGSLNQIPKEFSHASAFLLRFLCCSRRGLVGHGDDESGRKNQNVGS